MRKISILAQIIILMTLFGCRGFEPSTATSFINTTDSNVAARDLVFAFPLNVPDNPSVLAFGRLRADSIHISNKAYEIDTPVAQLPAGSKTQSPSGTNVRVQDHAPIVIP